MVSRILPAIRNKVVGIAGINFEALGPAVGAELYTFPPVSIGEGDLAEHVAFDEQGGALNKGDIFIGHIVVTMKECLFAVQVHVVGSFPYDIGVCFAQNLHTVFEIAGSIIIVIIKFSNVIVFGDLYSIVEAAAQRIIRETVDSYVLIWLCRYDIFIHVQLAMIKYDDKLFILIILPAIVAKKRIQAVSSFSAGNDGNSALLAGDIHLGHYGASFGVRCTNFL